MVDVLPKCPKCGEPPLKVSRGKGWHNVQLGFRSYSVGGKMEYVCGNGHKWEK